MRDLLTSPGGRVVLLSSIAAYRGSGGSSYGPAKAALHPFAYDLAAALGPRGVTVNVVAPGFVADTEFFAGSLTEQRREVLVGQTHTGRAGSPADVAQAIRWLGAWVSKTARDLPSRCPRSWSCAEDRSEPIR